MVMYPWFPVSFSSAFEAILFGIVYFGWVASEIIGAFILPRFRNRRNGVKLERKDRGSGFVVTFGIFVSIFVVLVFSQHNIAPLPEWVFYPGIVLMIAGIVLRQWSIAILGRFFSGTGECPGRSDHCQDRSLPVRPPPVVYGNTPHPYGDRTCRPVVGGRTGAVTGIRHRVPVTIPIEEKVLVAHIGEEYRDYMKNTKMLLPYIL